MSNTVPFGVKTGPVRKFMDLDMFACDGFICIVDNRPHKQDSSVTVVTCDDLEHRVRTLMQRYRDKTRVDLSTNQKEMEDARTQGANNAMECIKEARHMGDPSDPAVQEYWRRHRRMRAVSFSFSPEAAKILDGAYVANSKRRKAPSKVISSDDLAPANGKRRLILPGE